MPGVEFAVSEGTATVTLNRPEARNAITLAMWKDIASIFTELRSDRNVRTILLKGSGGNFSVGADVSEFSEVRNDAAASTEYEICVDAASDAIATTPQPVMAVLRGYCLGGACHLCLACDFRYGHTTTSIGIPAAKLSIVYSVKTTRRLLSIVGPVQAKRMLFSAERLWAEEAHRIGLIDRVVEDPEAQAMAFARSMSELAPLSIAGAKYIIDDLCEGGRAAKAQAIIDAASNSKDYLEARRAFAEKRQPSFGGS